MTRWDIERAIFGSSLAPTARLVLLALCALSDAKNGEIPDEFMPSLTRLEAMTGLARSTVVEQLKGLEKSGWLTRKPPPIIKAQLVKARTKYRLKVPKGSPLTGLPGPEDTDLASPTTGLVGPTTGLELVRPPDGASPTTGQVLTALNQAKPQQRAEQIVMEHIGANRAEATAIVNRVRNERNPRSIGGLLRRMAEDGDLAQLLAEHRGAVRRSQVAAALDSLRKGPPCDHGVAGGESAHPTSGEPLCPQCRFRARIPFPSKRKDSA